MSSKRAGRKHGGDYFVGWTSRSVWLRGKWHTRRTNPQTCWEHCSTTKTEKNKELPDSPGSYTCLRNHCTFQYSSDFSMEHAVCESKKTSWSEEWEWDTVYSVSVHGDESINHFTYVFCYTKKCTIITSDSRNELQYKTSVHLTLKL